MLRRPLREVVPTRPRPRVRGAAAQALTIAAGLAVAVACAGPSTRAPRKAETSAPTAAGKVTFKDHLGEFLVDATRPGADRVAAARSAWTVHEQRLGYLVRDTFFAGLDAVERDRRTAEVLDAWASDWDRRLERLRRLQITFSQVVERTRASFERTFRRLPDVELHLAFVPDARRYAAGRVFADRVVVVNAASLGAADEVVGRVTVVHALFEALRTQTGVSAGATTGEGLCAEALAVRAAALVYPTLETDSWAGLATPPGAFPLQPLLPPALVAVRDGWASPDPRRGAAGEARPLLLLELERSALPATQEADEVLALPAERCLTSARALFGAPQAP